MLASAVSALLSRLSELEYRFTSVTPETHALVLSHRRAGPAKSLRDVLGWSRSFTPEILPPGVFELMQAADACAPAGEGQWRPTLRVSSVGHLLFAHSAFPTLAPDAVFFGPDSYRFARAIRQLAPSATRAVDIGCGSGVGGIVLAHFGSLTQPLVLADINERALLLARANADHAGIQAEIVKSDVLTEVNGAVDLIIANPPYLIDPAARAYRHGGGGLGLELSLRIARESLARLERDGGGSLLLYTGVAMVDGLDPLLASLGPDLSRLGARFSYEEIDPDVFAGVLGEHAYADVERVAVVLLHATVGRTLRA